MVTVSAERVVPRFEGRVRAVWPAWLGAVALVLPLLVPALFAPLRLSLAPDLVLAAIEPTFEAPLSVRSPLGLWLVLLLVGWFGLAYRSRSARWWEFAFVALAGGAALPREGNAWLAGLLLIVPLGRQMARLSSAACAALAAVGVGGAIALALVLRPPLLPAGALQAASAAHGRVFTDYRWAGQLRAVQDIGPDYVRVAQGHERWQSILDADAVSVVVLDAADRERAAAELVRQSADWQVLFDQSGVLVAERAQR